MARLRSPEKYAAILNAAILEIAEAGLAAPTAKIAARAGIAAGTLFTYFRTKEGLLNELYLDLKTDVYSRVETNFPAKASLERRAHHIWTTYLDWAIEYPEKRKASTQLNVSDIITPETRAKAAALGINVAATLKEFSSRETLRNLPQGFAAATMAAMQEATMDFIHKEPRKRKQLIDQAFQLYWRAMR